MCVFLETTVRQVLDHLTKEIERILLLLLLRILVEEKQKTYKYGKKDPLRAIIQMTWKTLILSATFWQKFSTFSGFIENKMTIKIF